MGGRATPSSLFALCFAQVPSCSAASQGGCTLSYIRWLIVGARKFEKNTSRCRHFLRSRLMHLSASGCEVLQIPEGCGPGHTGKAPTPCH